ncbi:MAG: S41 family peptidase [Candidatus Eremiobacteraeota bacterium]|nr:S41 family peptidase [Candidatus Eremiobacteraeota bacterium]
MIKSYGRPALIVALIAGLCGPGAAAAQYSGPPTGIDLRESYRLLTTTYYSKVEPQQVLDGARGALVKLVAFKHGKGKLAALHAGTSEANVAAIQAEITKAAAQSHVSQTIATYVAIDGMARSLGDRYTAFFTPDQLKQFNAALDPAKISGIGVLIQPADSATGFISAFYVVPGTPADSAGVQSGDVFTQIDGRSTKGMKTDDATKALRGKAGTNVSIQVERDGKPLPQPITITRADVQPPTVIYKTLGDNIGYIWILAFGQQTTGEFNVALNRLQDSGAKAYVLDLRNDGGGYVNTALDISDRFISNLPIVSVKEGGRTTTIEADNTAVPRKPMRILVNRYTASASEITAGALQDDGIAQLVGEKTFGKGVVQTLTPLPDGAGIKITTARYYTPKNRDINLKGIVPDVSVTENKDARLSDPAHDAQLQAALDLLQKQIADSKGTT